MFKYLGELYNNDLKSIELVELYDIGCGGGNILDALIENSPNNIKLYLGGCDISESAINHLNNHFASVYDTKVGSLVSTYGRKFDIIDCEDLDSNNPPAGLLSANIVTIVDVMYYWGNKRDYRVTLDNIWDSLSRNTIALVADSIIPYQRRSYFKTKSDCKVLEKYTDYTVPMGQLNNTSRNRFLKVKIYQKM